MNLSTVAKHLRAVADSIDQLLGVERRPTAKESKAAAGKILKDIVKGAKPLGRPRKRKKLHWTQRPENKAKVREMTKQAAKTRGQA